MLSILAQHVTDTAEPTAWIMKAVGAGVLLYCVVTIAMFWAYARTRLYPLYVLKILWVGFTFVGFFWLISMSLSDPGPRHGGVASEFMKNPAGPYGALAAFPEYIGPYGLWLAAAALLLLMWRGLAGSPKAEEDSPERRRVRTIFLGVTTLVLALLLALANLGLRSLFERLGPLLLLAAAGAWALWPMRLKRRAYRWGLIALGLIALGPLALAIYYWRLPGEAQSHWQTYSYMINNYVFAWKTARMGDYMLNSVMVSLLTVGVTSVCASMAAYALARFTFRGRSTVLYGFIGAMVIPAQLYIVPLFFMIRDWTISAGPVDFSFMDSRLGLSLIYAAAGLPFAIFLLTGFYRTLPGTLREAAAIDGCSEWRVFSEVYFPLAAPGMATAAIFQFLGVWNEYQFALVFLTNDKLKTLPVGLYNLSVSQQYAANWSSLFAGITILCLPTFLIFVVLQERIVAGLTVGAVKE